ncbi:hypothetical protein LCGC14_0443770 [marine sediment metagenome]|uniref:Terminase large subunit gp17-like C-terminal domain-containing protein n=1 Tax=marine sediment metagenome TaxID=412755 RepID=A0A0F9V6N6_9ZZZZ
MASPKALKVKRRPNAGAWMVEEIRVVLEQERARVEVEAGREAVPWYDTLAEDEQEALARCEEFPRGFYEFLRHWKFVNRETGIVGTFEELWPGQEAAAERMVAHKWLFLLKAGKLGFSELECAWDGYVARFAQQRANVNIFSKDGPASRELLEWVKYGVKRLPRWMGIEILDVAGGDTLTSLKFHVRGTEADDVRNVNSYAASEHVAIESTATHAHVDELSHMKFAEIVWGAVSTTVSPWGSLHIVSRGAGPSKYSARLWKQAMAGRSEKTYELEKGRRAEGLLVPFFAPWHARPREPLRALEPGEDPFRAWYEEQRGTRSLQRLLHYAPETPEDALAGDETAQYIPLAVWDNCRDYDMPALIPGDRQAAVLAMDAAVSSDSFAVAIVTRHPDHEDAEGRACNRTKADPAIRAVRIWRPDPVTGVIDHDLIEQWVRMVCWGGCHEGHANRGRETMSAPPDGEECAACKEGRRQPGLNVVQITYDEFQLHGMAGRFTKDGVAWVDKFPQTTERLIADADLYKLAMSGALAHNGDPELREHISNARAKLQSDEDSRMRIVKASPQQKVDGAVASSMGVKRILELNVA